MPKFKVFMSYAEEDADFARDLGSRLSELGLRVLDPRQEVIAGDNIPLKVGEALEECDAMVVLLSAESFKSPWVRSEVEYALVAPKFEHRLIPVLLERTQDFPWILQKMPLVNASKNRNRVANRILRQLQSVKPA